LLGKGAPFGEEQMVVNQGQFDLNTMRGLRHLVNDAAKYLQLLSRNSGHIKAHESV